ncbi:hypothetical protein OROMI_024306 [Orobanche minor]
MNRLFLQPNRSMKSLTEMDLEEWELLPDEGFLEISDDGGQKIYTRKDSSSSSSDIQMNYFICPPKTGRHRRHHQRHCLLPVPIDLQSQQSPVDVNIKSVSAGDQEPEVSQIFFKKMKETEFVDMKLDSPKSGSICGGIMRRKDFQFGENVGIIINTTCKEAGDDDKVDGSEKKSREMELDHHHHHDEDEDEEGGLWKWIGAGMCSFGVAAATFCIVSLSIQRVNSNKHLKQMQNQKLPFQIYTNDDNKGRVIGNIIPDLKFSCSANTRPHYGFIQYVESSTDKIDISELFLWDRRIKQVVHHASKLNEAVPAA